MSHRSETGRSTTPDAALRRRRPGAAGGPDRGSQPAEELVGRLLDADMQLILWQTVGFDAWPDPGGVRPGAAHRRRGSAPPRNGARARRCDPLAPAPGGPRLGHVASLGGDRLRLGPALVCRSPRALAWWVLRAWSCATALVAQAPSGTATPSASRRARVLLAGARGGAQRAAGVARLGTGVAGSGHSSLAGCVVALTLLLAILLPAGAGAAPDRTAGVGLPAVVRRAGARRRRRRLLPLAGHQVTNN